MLSKLMFEFFKKKEKPKEKLVGPKEQELEKATEKFVNAIKDLTEKEKQDQQKFNKAMEFEVDFYGRIADGKNFKILLIPDETGKYPTEKEVNDILQLTTKEGNKLLYQFNEIGTNNKLKVSIIFSPYTNLTGLIYPRGTTGYHA